MSDIKNENNKRVTLDGLLDEFYNEYESRKENKGDSNNNILTLDDMYEKLSEKYGDVIQMINGCVKSIENGKAIHIPLGNGQIMTITPIQDNKVNMCLYSSSNISATTPVCYCAYGRHLEKPSNTTTLNEVMQLIDTTDNSYIVSDNENVVGAVDFNELVVPKEKTDAVELTVDVVPNK